MLYLSRKLGESIIINNSIELTVVEIKGKAVKLGFTFPPEATVLRKELHQKISEQNLAAASLEEGWMDALGTPEPDGKNDGG